MRVSIYVAMRKWFLAIILHFLIRKALKMIIVVDEGNGIEEVRVTVLVKKAYLIMHGFPWKEYS